MSLVGVRVRRVLQSYVQRRGWGSSLYGEVPCPKAGGSREQSLDDEVQCIMDNGHMGPLPVDRMRDRHH